MSNTDIKTLYQYYIYKRYSELIASGKEIDNYDLCKIFEWYTCLKLSEERGVDFYEYNDIDATFKEDNNMSRHDTGIDACNLDDTVVQCKLRKERLSFQECSTFFASQNAYDNELGKTVVRWNNMIIARNNDCKLSRILEQKATFKLFEDRGFERDEMIRYCEELLANPPQIKNNIQVNFQLRDYQLEAIDIIKNNDNSIICLPTGCGKNIVVIYSLEDDKKYLILVPRIILMDQLYEEIIKHKPQYRDDIECVGDGNNAIDANKKIYICVYNSIGLLQDRLSTFDKIYIDEAHHIYKPAIYQEMEDEEVLEDNEVVEESSNPVSEIQKEKEPDNSEESDEEDISDTDSTASTEEDESEIESITTDDQDELRPTEYMKIMRDLVKYKNNVYLSATIDEIDGFTFYKKDIREMIEKRYLCDYNIHIPIFDDDPSNRNICEYLINNYRNTIIYCSSQKEGKVINSLMNEIQPGCCEYIDCNTGKEKRNNILSKYKNDEICFLINVKVLVEGFDAPITKGVVFLHLPSNQTTLIQIIGRALRLHSSKTIASVVLPFSKIDEEKNITNFMRVMAKNDTRIMRSYIDKKLGGYINIENLIIDDINNSIDVKFIMIYDSFGRLINSCDVWYYKLKQVKNYIDKYAKRPLNGHKNKYIRQLGEWVSTQTKNYKNRSQIMKNHEIYSEWNTFINSLKYKRYFMTIEEAWYEMYHLVTSYIDENLKKPSRSDKNEVVKKMGRWISSQAKKYNKKIEIMKNNTIYNEWHMFVTSDQYRRYFTPDEAEWRESHYLVKKYIDDNQKLPSAGDKNESIKKIGRWVALQRKNYRYKCGMMNKSEIFNQWTMFITSEQYRQYFTSNEDIWYEMYYNLTKYIDENNRRPSSADKNEEVRKLGSWIANQLKNYKCRLYIMKNDEIYNQWHDFIASDRYKKYFSSNEEAWYEMFYKVKSYIDDNRKKPSSKDKNENTRQMNHWINTQTQNYKNISEIMKNNHVVYDEWETFITSSEYKQYFISKEEVWYEMYQSVKKYIDQNAKKPTQTAKNEDIKILGNWIQTQMDKYKKKSQIMKNSEFYNEWTNFITSNQYEQYFLSKEQTWYKMYQAVKKYIDQNGKRPTQTDKNKYIEQLGNWIQTQLRNYKNKSNIMKDNGIYDEWTKFITSETYSQYFSL